jgi:precorrin-3B synthase
VSPALDACPGVLTLHPARDGLVARIRLPGGYASPARWRALADLSRGFGDGCVDLTARGNVQLRGLRAADASALAARAASAGLMPSAQHDRARNITASPLAGLGGRPPLRSLVDALDAALLAGPEFAALPGRFLFALDDGTGGASLASCDIGLSWVAGAPASGGPTSGVIAGGGPAGGRPAGGGLALGGPASGGFDLYVAGRHTGVRVPAGAAVAAVLAATRAALAAGVGDSVTRVAALPDGGESVAAAAGGTFGAPASPDTRLPLGPVPGSRARGADLHDRDRFTAGTSGESVAIMEGARAEAGAEAKGTSGISGISPRRPTGPTGSIDAEGTADFHDRDRLPPVFAVETVVIMENSSREQVLVVAARLGRLTGDQIEAIAGLVAPGEVVRVGVAGRLAIPVGGAADGGSASGAGPAGGSGQAGGGGQAGGTGRPGGGGTVGGALARLAAAGLIVSADDPMGDVTACSGAACHRSLADVRAAAGPVPNYGKTHWAGCSRRCGCPPDAEPVVALDATRYRMPGEGGA